jgi:HK97 family phage portal protein
MSLLARATAPRALKAIDQVQYAQEGAIQYIPLREGSTYPVDGSVGALNVITVYQCVRVLAETFAMLPLFLYRRVDKGKERAVDHPLYSVLHDQANPDMTSFVWRELLMSHLATWGNAYCEKAYDGLGRLQLYPIRPDRMTPRYNDAGEKVFDYQPLTGPKTTYGTDKIFHVPGMSSNGLSGFSPIQVMRSTIHLLRTTEQFGDAFFSNGARPAVVLQHPRTLSEPAIKRLTAQMDELRGSKNAGKTILLEENMTVTEVGIPPEDAQFLGTRLFQKRELAAGYRIPPHKIGDLERATFSNIEQQSLEFITDTMMPWFVRTEQEITNQLLDESERDEYFAEFLIDGYLRGDSVARAQAYEIRFRNANLSADEWRAKENENPLPDGIGGQYYVPVNYASVNPLPGQQLVTPATVRETVPAPIQPGEAPQLVAVKAAIASRSAAAGFCPACGARNALKLGPGSEIVCRKCKEPIVVPGIAEPASKSLPYGGSEAA